MPIYLLIVINKFLLIVVDDIITFFIYNFFFNDYIVAIFAVAVKHSMLGLYQ
jgi:hypothetical protein